MSGWSRGGLVGGMRQRGVMRFHVRPALSVYSMCRLSARRHSSGLITSASQEWSLPGGTTACQESPPFSLRYMTTPSLIIMTPAPSVPESIGGWTNTSACASDRGIPLIARATQSAPPSIVSYRFAEQVSPAHPTVSLVKLIDLSQLKGRAPLVDEFVPVAPTSCQFRPPSTVR